MYLTRVFRECNGTRRLDNPNLRGGNLGEASSPSGVTLNIIAASWLNNFAPLRIRSNLWKENAVAAAAVTTIAHLTILIELHCCSPTRKGRQSIMAYNPIPSATLSIVQWDNAIVARMP
ncbi:uncharacterized protein LOC120356945 isoform X2 [Solenopsis invicta]|uniref:uncharacterized protein LOC120356945 isoform X2 n=1 Tax=Solenopsis invicta TaxID=13686 RepID=UPI00193D042C|nr:uncharacterized protein LOC120356945 isoform X2 [Solenopsis invicta]